MTNNGHNKTVLFGAFNPIHYGHLKLIELGLCFSHQLDIFVGYKERLRSLDWHTRVEGVELCLEEQELSERVTVLEKCDPLTLNGEHYGSMICGSDFLNASNSANPVAVARYKPYFQTFEDIICVQRKGKELTQGTYLALQAHANIHLVSPVSQLAACDIRNSFSPSTDLSEYMPYEVADHLSRAARQIWL